MLHAVCAVTSGPAWLCTGHVWRLCQASALSAMSTLPGYKSGVFIAHEASLTAPIFLTRNVFTKDAKTIKGYQKNISQHNDIWLFLGSLSRKIWAMRGADLFLFGDFDWARFLKDRLEDFEFVEFDSETRELPGGIESIKSRSFVTKTLTNGIGICQTSAVCFSFKH